MRARPGAPALAPGPRSGPPLVTHRNNSNPSPWEAWNTPLREAPAYVQKCGTGTVALLLDGGSRVAFTAMLCSSWNCPSCRRGNAAQLLDRATRGMESRADWRRTFITLTVDPSKFGAKPAGIAAWDAAGKRVPLDSPNQVRRSRLWKPPTAKQFRLVAETMSEEWNRLNERLGRKARREGTCRHEYLRVIELHRNAWPHYHVVIEHPEWGWADIERQVRGWGLGIVHRSVGDGPGGDVTIGDAVAELTPYLVNKEGHGKAYQFAGAALPKNFRLYSPSRDFLAEPQAPEHGTVEHSLPLSGHFFTHHRNAREWGASSLIILNPPGEPDERHRPPGSAVATGDAARLYYLGMLEHRVQLSPEAEQLARAATTPSPQPDSHSEIDSG